MTVYRVTASVLVEADDEAEAEWQGVERLQGTTPNHWDSLDAEEVEQ
jgi:hypothetical protein